MKKQTGFTLIEILIVLAVSIIVAAGGKVIWEKNITISPTPTSPVPTSVNCQTDADCPRLDCIQGCPAEGPCPPCGQYKCINGECQRVYPDYSESLNKKIQLSTSQTVTFQGTTLSLTLLKITATPSGCFDCPTTAGIKVQSANDSKNISFTVGVLANQETAAKMRVQEAFGFKIILEKLQSERIILQVEKL